MVFRDPRVERWARIHADETLVPISLSQHRRGRISAMIRMRAGQVLLDRLLAILFWVGMCCVSVAAQRPPKPHSSASPRQIILPSKVIAGAQATLAVLDSQGRLMPNVIVDLSGGQKVTTDATGRALFNVPGGSGTMAAKIVAQGIASSTKVVAAENSGPGAAPEGAKIVDYPRVVAIHDRFTLQGSGLRGAADSNHVFLNGDPCLVLASSPVSLVALPGPHVPVGDIKLRVAVAGADAGEFPVSAVILEFSGPAEAVSAGSAGTLTLRARGTTLPLNVEVRNGSPKVIQLAKGNVQRLKTSGGDQNIASIEVQFVTGGNYSVSAKFISADRQ